MNKTQGDDQMTPETTTEYDWNRIHTLEFTEYDLRSLMTLIDGGAVILKRSPRKDSRDVNAVIQSLFNLRTKIEEILNNATH